MAYNFFAYDVKFDGGARVDMADLNGDGGSGADRRARAVDALRRVTGSRLRRPRPGLLIEFVPFAG